jgi:excisionase family DNA binding protein
MISSDLRHGVENGYLMASKSTVDREWMSLRELTEYASVSERTLRDWLRRSTDALPGVRVNGKVLIRRSEFDAWLERHRIRPDSVDVGKIVDDVLKGVR